MSILDEFILSLGQSSHMDSLEQMLSFILAKSRRHTSAEAGSIFVVRPLEGENQELQAYSIQNDRIPVKNEMFTIPLSTSSIAGYVASTGEVLEIDDLYELDASLPFKFNRSFDDKDGYRSMSMLAFPLKNYQGHVIGVVQLLNHIEGVDALGKPNYAPFPMSHVDDMKSVMTILGAMVERVDLLGEIKTLKAKIEELEG